MKEKLVFLIVVSFLLQSFVLLAQVTIGVIGDQTGSYDLTLQEPYAKLKEGCDKLLQLNPDLVLHVGDIVESDNDNDTITANFYQAVAYLNKIGVPWYITAGDHDVTKHNKDHTIDYNGHAKERLFLNLIKNEYLKRKPQIKTNNLYYSFDFKGYHFICLYSQENLGRDPRWGNIFMAKIPGDETQGQYFWLKNDLEGASSSNGTIVFLHQPLWYNWTGWERIHNLLKKYNVIAVIAGHFHYNQHENKDGISYLVVGAAGANIKDASENAGGLHHVTLMTLSNSSNIDFKLIPLAGYSRKVFTGRENMDRIQAIDSMITMFPYEKDYKGKAVGANPTDLPVDVMSSGDGKSWECAFYQVLPGTGISLSNLSSVELSNSSPPETVDSAGGTRISFRSNRELYWNQVLYTENDPFFVPRLRDRSAPEGTQRLPKTWIPSVYSKSSTRGTLLNI